MKKLILNPDNPRTIQKESFEKLKKSLKEFPQMLDIRPIIYDETDTILGGNMRYRALEELEKEGFEIKDSWFKNINDLTPEQKREFVIKDNLPFGDWDYDILANEWSDLPLADWGLNIPDWKQLDTTEDEAPELSNEEPKSKAGEVYQIGKHRVMCGDSTKIEDVAILMGDQRADMIFTDPLYNVDYVGKTKDALKIQNDKFSNEGFYQFLYDAFSNMSAYSKAGASAYICHADSEGLNFRKSFIDAGYLLKQCIVWNKNSMVMGRQDYQWKHEPILYGWKDGASHTWYGSRSETTVWDMDRPSRPEEHPTMKPIELIGKALNNSSKSEDIILDLFLGSGSTLIACEQLNRVCYGMELDEKYIDVIRRRYWKFVNNGDETGWEEHTPKLN